VVATAVSVYYHRDHPRPYTRTELSCARVVGGSPPARAAAPISVGLSLGVVFASFIFVEPLINPARRPRRRSA
jgi:hypothetical protein